MPRKERCVCAGQPAGEEWATQMLLLHRLHNNAEIIPPWAVLQKFLGKCSARTNEKHTSLDTHVMTCKTET